MIAFDTNILFPALEESHANHNIAREFLGGLATFSRVAICELVLIETYVLLRNPTICRKPLSHPQAIALIEQLRTNPEWRLLDYPGGIMDDVWKHPHTDANIPRRRIFDLRLAITLIHHGVTEFATANVKDFQDLGFKKVWNPLES